MTTHDHIGELAELYALGTLDDSERARVDSHVRSCGECARRLGEAETSIAGTMPELEPSPQLDRRIRAAFAPRTPALRLGPLIAAAFVLGLLPGAIFGVLHRTASPFESDRDSAIAAMVNSHFLHAQFTPLAPDAPKAKVLYGRGKPWRFFVAQTNHAYAVRALDAGGASDLGTLHVSGDAAELFVPNSGAHTFVLLDGSRPVARVHLP